MFKKVLMCLTYEPLRFFHQNRPRGKSSNANYRLKTLSNHFKKVSNRLEIKIYQNITIVYSQCHL
jgi:hypothetical protein